MKSDLKDLKDLIRQGERYNLEFKEAFNDSLGKEICAMANANGGKILLGVSDTGEIKGVHITNRLKSQIQDIVRNFDPIFQVSFKDIGNVLVVNVLEGSNKPHADWFSVTFKRPDLQRQTFEERSRPVDRPIDRVKDMVSDRVKDRIKLLSVQEKRIIKLIAANPKITALELTVALKINERNTRAHLAKLREKNLLARVGSDKSGYWQVKKV